MRILILTSLILMINAWTSYAVAQDVAVTPAGPAVSDEVVTNADAPVAENDVGAEQNVDSSEGRVDSEDPEIQSDETVVASINPNAIPSLLFTYYEYTAIEDAKNSRGSIIEDATFDDKDFKFEEEKQVAKPPPEKRDIKLGGIVYKSNKDWTIWLNGQRITPGALPKEVIDLKVYEQFIEVKWYDIYTKQILPIRLRPHQRFNIDTRIFLPG